MPNKVLKLQALAVCDVYYVDGEWWLLYPGIKPRAYSMESEARWGLSYLKQMDALMDAVARLE